MLLIQIFIFARKDDNNFETMKNLKKLLNSLLIVNIVLILAVAALFVIYFTSGSGGTDNKPGDKKEQKSELATAEDSVIAERIAVVKLDTLLAEYELAQELNEDLLEEQKRAEANLQQKMSKFEKDYESFEEKARLGSFISQSSMQAQQEDLQRQQAELQQLNSELSMELSKQQEQLTQSLYDSVLNVMPKINNGRFVLILGDAIGTNVLYSNDAMDITDEVVEYLNDRYARKQEAEK